MNIIDMHAHAFPDKLAEKAVSGLEKAGGICAFLDGRISSLLKSMDDAGIDLSVVASIATKPEQYGPIRDWSKSIASSRIIPFPSFHPADPDALSKIDDIAFMGFKGIKLHPYYQDFVTDDEALYPLYDRIRRRDLVLLIHAGYDIAFPRTPRGTPRQMAAVMERFPGLKMVVSHLGGWEDGNDALRFIIGRDIYIDVAVALGQHGNRNAKDMILSHPGDYVLFASDSPWESQAETALRIREMRLPPERERKLFGENAVRLLGL